MLRLFAIKPVRSQLYYGVATLLIVVLILSAAGFYGVLKFRKLTKSIRDRASELPLAAALHQQVSDLRVSFSEIRRPSDFRTHNSPDAPFRAGLFRVDLAKVRRAIADYRSQLDDSLSGDPRITDTSVEQAAVDRICYRIDRLDQATSAPDWVFDDGRRVMVADQLEWLQHDVSQLPGLMKQRMDEFAEQARAEYHATMLVSASMTVVAVALLCLLVRRFHQRIFQPLHRLVIGSRRVAGGQYDYRIVLGTNDEFSELAEALNAMTANFQAISTDLQRQVQLRTKEVIRSEQLASVGFLAAGVAHEINNPLASIAWSAEALESRVAELCHGPSGQDDPQRQQQVLHIQQYLRRIQDEAFRCKGITCGLLDFSRLGDTHKAAANLSEIVGTVVEIVQPLGKYRDKHIELALPPVVMATVNEQEIKQVVLNLLTNALDSVAVGGHVKIHLDTRGNQAVLTITDNGCGMSDEVLEHLFEPFFTRRRDGQGTGLGLAITYRILEEHGGTIEPQSDGPDRGSTFTVTLPLTSHNRTRENHERQAA